MLLIPQQQSTSPPPSMPISVISAEDNNFSIIELPPTETDVNHLQEQFSQSVCDPSSQDDSVQAFPEQVVAKKFFMRVTSLIFLISKLSVRNKPSYWRRHLSVVLRSAYLWKTILLNKARLFLKK